MPVCQLDSRSGNAQLFGSLFAGNSDFSVIRGNFCLFHQKFNLKYLIVRAFIPDSPVQGIIVTADNFHPGGFTADLIINDTVSCHVDTHVGWGFIGVGTVDSFKNCIQHRENFNIPVVIYSSFPIGFQMEGVNHVDIIQICRCSLVCQIDRML